MFYFLFLLKDYGGKSNRIINTEGYLLSSGGNGMSGIVEDTGGAHAGHGCRRLWRTVLGASKPEHGVSVPFLGIVASVLLGFACASAAIAATTAGQAHGIPLATHLPTFLLTDKHPMALALPALAILLILGRGYYLYRALIYRERLQGFRT